MLHVSHPYLVSLSFYTIPIMPLFFKFTGFLNYLSPLIFIYYYVYLCERGRTPYKKFIIEINACGRHGNDVIRMRTKCAAVSKFEE